MLPGHRNPASGSGLAPAAQIRITGKLSPAAPGPGPWLSDSRRAGLRPTPTESLSGPSVTVSRSEALPVQAASRRGNLSSIVENRFRVRFLSSKRLVILFKNLKNIFSIFDIFFVLRI